MRTSTHRQKDALSYLLEEIGVVLSGSLSLFVCKQCVPEDILTAFPQLFTYVKVRVKAGRGVCLTPALSLFQESEPISRYLHAEVATELRQSLAKMGMDMLLKMVRTWLRLEVKVVFPQKLFSWGNKALWLKREQKLFASHAFGPSPHGLKDTAVPFGASPWTPGIAVTQDVGCWGTAAPQMTEGTPTSCVV